MNDRTLFEELLQILLEEDRKKVRSLDTDIVDIGERVNSLEEEVSGIKDEVSDIKDGIDDPDKLSGKVDPLLDIRIEKLRNNFHDIFGKEVAESVRIGIDNSKDEFVEALYPIMGKMIRRYVRYQFESVMQSVNQKMENTFSLRNWGNRMKGWFAGVDAGEMVIAGSVNVKLSQLFVIHRNSGLLIAKYPKEDIADADMIAAMLSAIKSFVEDAFQQHKDGENLEVIQYGGFNIIINDFHQYYVATVLDGPVDVNVKSKLLRHLNRFAEIHMPKQIDEVDSEIFENVSELLKLHFEAFKFD